MVLSHAGPAQLTVGDVVKVKGALCRRQTADGIAAGQARLLRVLLQSARPQLLGDLGEGHVAAVGEGGGDVLLPVGAGADDGLVPIWTLPEQVQVRSASSGISSRAAARVTVLYTDPGVKVEDRKRFR